MITDPDEKGFAEQLNEHAKTNLKTARSGWVEVVDITTLLVYADWLDDRGDPRGPGYRFAGTHGCHPWGPNEVNVSTKYQWSWWNFDRGNYGMIFSSARLGGEIRVNLYDGIVACGLGVDAHNGRCLHYNDSKTIAWIFKSVAEAYDGFALGFAALEPEHQTPAFLFGRTP